MITRRLSLSQSCSRGASRLLRDDLDVRVIHEQRTHLTVEGGRRLGALVMRLHRGRAEDRSYLVSVSDSRAIREPETRRSHFSRSSPEDFGSGASGVRVMDLARHQRERARNCCRYRGPRLWFHRTEPSPLLKFIGS